jgi:penicillin-binding protein 1C
MKKVKNNFIFILLISILLLLFIFIIFIPSPVKPLLGRESLTIVSENGSLLRVYLNNEDSWCLKSTLLVPQKLKDAVILYEDKYFYYHFGVNPISLIRALIVNIKAKKVKLGGSTISMQVARISGRRSRNIPSKIVEIFQALKLELFHSKEYILKLYLDHAPYGGNIYGYRTASLRYFGKEPEYLSWAEAATLAVLPNSPSLISPLVSQDKLKSKRNELLLRLYEAKKLSYDNYQMALIEDVPMKNLSFQVVAPQFCDTVVKNKKNYKLNGSSKSIITTTLDIQIQQLVEGIIQNHTEIIHGSGISNISALVVDAQTGDIKAWIGSQDFSDDKNKGQINGVLAPRSTGSILKPFLYALAIDRGLLLPDTLLADIPTIFGSYSPSNASGTFSGLVTAKDALINSLNVPAVRVLSSFGVDEFYQFLKRAGLRHLFRSSIEYGLPLVLGGAEATLYEIAQLYYGLVNKGYFSQLNYLLKDSVLNSKANNLKPDTDKKPNLNATQNDKLSPTSKNEDKNGYKLEKETKVRIKKGKKLISDGSCYLILDILKDLKRPDVDQLWEFFNSSKPVAWKTGTSYGYKDAWAVGANPSWIVAVWSGNFDGTPNVLLSGGKVSGPIMLDIINALPSKSSDRWFKYPDNALVNLEVCSKTGYAVSSNCPEKKYVDAPVGMLPLQPCPYHKIIYTTLDGKYEVCSNCWKPGEYEKKYVLAWSPEISQYIRDTGLIEDQKPLHNPLCQGFSSTVNMQIIYPGNGLVIVVPKDLNGKYQKVIFQAAHQSRNTYIFWYLNGLYLGKTAGNNNIAFLPPEGENILTIVDQQTGKSISSKFIVIYSSRK